MPLPKCTVPWYGPVTPFWRRVLPKTYYIQWLSILKKQIWDINKAHKYFITLSEFVFPGLRINWGSNIQELAKGKKHSILSCIWWMAQPWSSKSWRREGRLSYRYGQICNISLLFPYDPPKFEISHSKSLHGLAPPLHYDAQAQHGTSKPRFAYFMQAHVDKRTMRGYLPNRLACDLFILKHAAPSMGPKHIRSNSPIKTINHPSVNESRTVERALASGGGKGSRKDDPTNVSH